jgi:D-glycero-alpha-D-manno-heptose 1-phosphate guanylyltransferase
MAPVAGKPFLSYVIDAFRIQGVERFVFSLGFKSEVIETFLKEHYPTLNYAVAIEDEPLGTGGGIRLALQKTKAEDVLIANGDTLFKVNVGELFTQHKNNNAECTLALKRLKDFDRYGVVEIDEAGRIQSFKEKQHYAEGLINGGVYVLNKEKFFQRSFPWKFSFEKEYLETFCKEGKFFGSVEEGYFIDIGIPEDYNRAQNDLAKKELNLKETDQTWTLFIDRDGVINDEIVGEYVLNWKGFHFSEGALEAFKILTQKFGKLLVVSNQRGVGKGLMTEDDLSNIHNNMKAAIGEAGGRIDNIYYCTEKEDTCFFRKPNPGMAVEALNDYPNIDLSKSIMIGNKPSDMRFGRATGMYTVFLTTTNPEQPFPHPDIDLKFGSLLEFAKAW